jgi:serine/threonine protein phosphatase 1
MRILAIGDVHGCAAALRKLLDAIEITPADTVIALGDYIDDGPDSNAVIGLLLRLERRCKLVPLLGNHEQMMLEARESPDKLNEWVRCGGSATLKSYRREDEVGRLSDVPRAHWQFLEERCQKYYQTPTHFFVHANAHPATSLEEQADYMLRWEQLRQSRPHVSGKTMICGHTSQKNGRILDLVHAVCIDTGPASGGWLTCYEPATRKYWQSNEAGELRMDKL